MEQIVLWSKQPKNQIRKGKRMRLMHYDALREIILGLFERKTEITLNDLFEETRMIDPSVFGVDNIYPMLILVKNDLEARGMLKIKIDQSRNQVISLAARKKRLV